ncbi:MAG TPA: hypothetical protein VF219_21595 [Vicinamibacterales bacterium]
MSEMTEGTGIRWKGRSAAFLALGAAVVFGLSVCGRKEPAPPKTPTPAPTAPPMTVVVTPTTTLPPDMQLDAKVDPVIARTLTAAAPAIPTAVGESPAERRQDLAPATPVPTIADHR